MPDSAAVAWIENQLRLAGWKKPRRQAQAV